MKRCFSLFFSISLLLFSLTGCGGEGTPASPEASNSVSPEPSAQFESGTIENNVYTNSYLALSFSLPEGWSFVTSEQFVQLFGCITEQVQGDLEVEAAPEDSTYYEFYAQGQSGESVIMTVEDLSAHKGGKLLTVRNFVDTLSEQYAHLSSVDYEIGESYAQTMAGHELIVLPLSVPSAQLRQHCCVFRSSSYMITLTFSAQTDEELQELEACLTEI